MEKEKNCFDKNIWSHLPIGLMDGVCFVYEVVAVREGQGYVGKS